MYCVPELPSGGTFRLFTFLDIVGDVSINSSDLQQAWASHFVSSGCYFGSHLYGVGSYLFGVWSGSDDDTGRNGVSGGSSFVYAICMDGSFGIIEELCIPE